VNNKLWYCVLYPYRYILNLKYLIIRYPIKAFQHINNFYHSCIYNRLPEDEPSDSKHVEDVVKIRILIFTKVHFVDFLAFPNFRVSPCIFSIP